jgi:hypothetical protein
MRPGRKRQSWAVFHLGPTTVTGKHGMKRVGINFLPHLSDNDDRSYATVETFYVIKTCMGPDLKDLLLSWKSLEVSSTMR